MVSLLSAKPKARRAKTVQGKIQWIIGVLFAVLVVSLANLARMSGDIMHTVDTELQEGRVSVYKTLQRFNQLRQEALQNAAKEGNDDDSSLVEFQANIWRAIDRFNAIGEEINEEEEINKQDNSQSEKENSIAKEDNLQAAHQMEHGGDEMEMYAAQQKQQRQQEQEKVVHTEDNEVIKGMPEWLDKWWKEHRAASEGKEWMQSKTMPLWMEAYFTWHKETKARINKKNYAVFRYVVMTCYKDEHCDNIPNRLRPLPIHLRLAADTKRLLLIHWDQPNRLETFVEPPSFGIDWRVPEFLMWKVHNAAQQSALDVIVSQSRQYKERKVVNSMFNADNEGEPYYNDRREEGDLTAEQVIHDVFHNMFVPTEALQARIDELKHFMPPMPDGYAVAHIDDPRIPQNDDERKYIYSHVENALNCLSNLMPGGPFLVFTETVDEMKMVAEFGRTKGIKIPAKPLNHEKHRVAENLITSFAEIFLMAKAKCIAYNNGGFGRFGYMLLERFDCHVRYAGKDGKTCEWVNAPPPMELGDEKK